MPARKRQEKEASKFVEQEQKKVKKSKEVEAQEAKAKDDAR
jgi:hypothetical protein